MTAPTPEESIAAVSVAKNVSDTRLGGGQVSIAAHREYVREAYPGARWSVVRALAGDFLRGVKVRRGGAS